MVTLALLSIVIVIIVEMDRPWRPLFALDQRAMIDAQDMMRRGE